MINLRRLVGNFLSVSAVRALGGLLSFLVIAYMARAWGVQRLGEFNTLLTFFLLLQQMPLLGLHLRISRDVASGGVVSDLASNGIVLALVAALGLGSGVAVIGQTLYPAHLNLAFALVGLSMLPTAATALSEAILTGQERISLVAAVNLIENVFRTISFAVCIHLGFEIHFLFLFFLVGRLIAASLYIAVFRIGAYITFERLSINVLVRFSKDIPVFISIVIIGAAINRIGILVLSQVGSLDDVGYFTPPMKIGEILLMIATIATFVWFPILSRSHAGSRHVFDQLVSFSLGVMGVALFPCLAVIAAFSETIMVLLFGAEFGGSAPILRVLCVAFAFMVSDKLLSAAMLASKRERDDLKVLAMSFSLFLVLMLILIPLFGALGLAWATAAGALAQFGIRCLLFQRRQWLVGSLLRLVKTGLAAGVMYLVMAGLLMTGTGWSLSILAGVFSYAGIALIVRVFRVAEIRQIRELLARPDTAPSP